MPNGLLNEKLAICRLNGANYGGDNPWPSIQKDDVYHVLSSMHHDYYHLMVHNCDIDNDNRLGGSQQHILGFTPS
jgi:hypothetical protein